MKRVRFGQKLRVLMTDKETHLGVRRSWKSLRAPKPRVIVHETGQNRPKLRVFTTDTKTRPGVHQSWKYVQDPKTGSNCPWNGPESAKTASVDDLHVNAPRGSSIVEITSGPQNSE